MAALVARTLFQHQLAQVFAEPAAIGQRLAPAANTGPGARLLTATAPALTPLPTPLQQWLSRLQLLSGVPINYLVPDEGMLPAESIRFFHLDQNWVAALVDGAYSIGRNLSNDLPTPSLNLDRATSPGVHELLRTSAGQARARALGQTPVPTTLQTVTGFLLRSSVVTAYPGLGVNAYPQEGTPTDGTATPLTILRLERLGPQSDTMLCLIDGDAYQVDVHEAPEHLHYGIDGYAQQGDAVTASKKIRLFSVDGNQVTISKDTADLNLNNSFRGTSRTLKMASVAGDIAKANNLSNLNAAQMGFEMTEGVGLVSFINNTPAQ